MTIELAIVLALLIAAIVMFAIDKPRMDVVALLMLTLLPLTQIITVNDALRGFSDPNIVLIAALFVIGDGLVRTGVARNLGDWLSAKAGSSETRMMILLMLVVCGLGSTMSSTAVTAIFIPVVLRICQSTGTPPSRLMMPLSCAALISGMMTLVATAPNLVVNSELIRFAEQHNTDSTGFRFFSFAPFGIPILLAAIGYMLIARKWLPATNPFDSKADTRQPTLAGWVEQYELATREQRVRISQSSPLVGKTIEEVGLRNAASASLVAIERERSVLQPTAKTILHSGDVLLVDFYGPPADSDALKTQFALEPMPLSGLYFTDRAQEIGMLEVIIPVDSELVGQSLISSEFRSRTGLTAIGLRRSKAAVTEKLREENLKAGDTLLLIGPWKAIRHLTKDSNYIVPLRYPSEYHDLLPAPGKAPYAVVSLLIVIGLMVSGVVPNVLAALIGCLLMGLFRCITIETAYKCIDWKTLILIVGMLPFSIALQETGGVELAAEGLRTITSSMGPRGVLAILFMITAILGMFISNTATAVLMAPVALAMAADMQASPYPFAMIVALAASTAFMTPVSSPVNTLVVTPGNYSFSDFVKVGIPLSVIVLVISVAMVPWLLPFYPAASVTP
ncbi:Citrate transporter [Planctopirus ephydatiae]|uniref:Citrate transporter n=1 Tax=Planctopirus ephydatiae TaxID=2528019 RepID=A0A518GP34_9PLAN|nr:SLC13 family permease [Planctopirus ephydatiae]QDV30388.1 Citrate transporter [Planctopirus ephydatiae]